MTPLNVTISRTTEGRIRADLQHGAERYALESETIPEVEPEGYDKQMKRRASVLNFADELRRTITHRLFPEYMEARAMLLPTNPPTKIG